MAVDTGQQYCLFLLETTQISWVNDGWKYPELLRLEKLSNITIKIEILNNKNVIKNIGLLCIIYLFP